MHYQGIAGKMGFGLALWFLISLLAVSFTATHPLVGLGIAAVGGMVLGICRQRRVSPRSQTLIPGKSRLVSWIHTHELYLLGPALLILVFSNRVPLAISFLALFWLLILMICRRLLTSRIMVATPLDLPILLLLLTAFTSLFASVELLLSVSDLLKFIGGLALFYGLVNHLDGEKDIRTVVLAFLTVGLAIALCVPLIMQFPVTKIPFVSGYYEYFPSFLPRWIQPNYMGGVLTFFFPMFLLGSVLRYRESGLWFGGGAMIIGVGLLMTQSRGALLGTLVALVLTGAWRSRRIRWCFPIVMGAVGLLVYFAGIETLLGPSKSSELGSMLAGRKEVWERAVYITQDFPFTGIGMHTFPVVIDLFYPLFLHGPNTRVPHPHNFFLSVAVDIGIPGFVAFWVLLGGWGGMVAEVVRRSISSEEDRSDEILGLGLAGGMIAYMVYGVTDAITLGEKAGVVFWTVMGLTVYSWRRVSSGQSAQGVESNFR